MSSPLLIFCQEGMLQANCYSLVALMCLWLWDKLLYEISQETIPQPLRNKNLLFQILCNFLCYFFFFFSRFNYMEISCEMSRLMFLEKKLKNVPYGLPCQLLQKEENFAVMTSSVPDNKTILVGWPVNGSMNKEFLINHFSSKEASRRYKFGWSTN